MSLCPPIDIDDTAQVIWDETATCPACGGVCRHPKTRLSHKEYEWDAESWECDDCDYAYPE